jgi:hypothetical protein
VHFGTVDCTVHQRICNQHGINAYPTTIFFNQSRPHRYQVGVFATIMHQRLSYHQLSSNRAGHIATRWECLQPAWHQRLSHHHLLQPEPTTPLSGRRVCNQHGINAYPTTIFFNQSRPHRYQVGVLYFIQPP